MALIANNWIALRFPKMRSLLAVMALLVTGVPALANEPAVEKPLAKESVTYLVIAVKDGYGVAVDKIPTANAAACEKAGEKFKAEGRGAHRWWCIDGIREVVEIRP